MNPCAWVYACMCRTKPASGKGTARKSRVCKLCMSGEMHKKMWHCVHLQVVSKKVHKKFRWCKTWKLWETAPFLAVPGLMDKAVSKVTVLRLMIMCLQHKVSRQTNILWLICVGALVILLCTCAETYVVKVHVYIKTVQSHFSSAVSSIGARGATAPSPSQWTWVN